MGGSACAECSTEATQTVLIDVLGVTLEMDLCDGHLDALLTNAHPISGSPWPTWNGGAR